MIRSVSTGWYDNKVALTFLNGWTAYIAYSNGDTWAEVSCADVKGTPTPLKRGTWGPDRNVSPDEAARFLAYVARIDPTKPPDVIDLEKI